MFKKNWPLYAGVFLVALSLLAIEVVLNRMFALTFWYHFGFMILSIALFGIGFGSVLVFFTNRFLKKYVPVVLAIMAIGMAVSIPLVLLKINSIPLELSGIELSKEQLVLFKEFFLLLVIPFVLGGYIFSSLFTNYSEDINRIYFFDLMGGGIGCFVAMMLFPGKGPFVVAGIVCVLVLAGAMFFAWRQHWLFAVPVAALVIAAIIIVPSQMKQHEVRVSKEKREVEAYGPKLFGGWDNFGYVALHRDSVGKKMITVDYSCRTYFYYVNGEKGLGAIKSMMADHYYPYVVKKEPENVGIVGVGAGKDITLALGVKAKNIYGAEFNATTINLMKEVFRGERIIEKGPLPYNIVDHPNVHIEFEEGRFFVKSSKRKYDVLVFDNSISQVAVSSGSFTLAESYLFTVEGMMDYINRLEKNGVIYLSNPYVDAPRFVTVLKEAFHRLGRDAEFAKSLLIFDQPGNYHKCKILVKNGAFTSSEASQVESFSVAQGFPALYTPNHRSGSYEERLVLSKDMEREYALSEREIRPSTDDWPFFSQYIKPDHQQINNEVQSTRRFYPQPFLMLRQISKEVAKWSILFLIVPLLFLNFGGLRKMPNKLGSMVYFSALGLGFMLIEVVMMQKYALILGHPINAFSIVLSTLLISSGIGSFSVKYIKNPYRAIMIALGGIIVSTVFSYLVLRFFSPEIIGLSFPLRAAIAALMIAFSGFFMGAMMPSGIKAIGAVPSSIPWMWSLNGVFSVLASFIAVNVSIEHGFTAVFALGLAVYAVGAILFATKLVVRD